MKQINIFICLFIRTSAYLEADLTVVQNSYTVSTGTCHCLTHPMSQHSHLSCPPAAQVTRHWGTPSGSPCPSWGFVALFEPQATDTSASPVQHYSHISLLVSQTVRLYVTSKIHQKKSKPRNCHIIYSNCWLSAETLARKCHTDIRPHSPIGYRGDALAGSSRRAQSFARDRAGVCFFNRFLLKQIANCSWFLLF